MWYPHPGVLFLRSQRPNEAAYVRDPSPVLDTEMSINEAAVLLPELKTLYEQSKETTLVRGAPSETAIKTGTGSPCWRSWPDLRVTSTPAPRTALDTLLAKNIDRQEAAVLVENREDQEFAEERARALKAEFWNEEVDVFINNNWDPTPYIPGAPTTAFQHFFKFRYSLFAGSVANIEAIADTRTSALSNDMCIVLGCALKFGIPVRLFECDGENIREVDPSSAVARNSVSFANLTADLAAARKNTAQESTVWVPCDWCDPDNWYGADYGNGLLDIGVPLLKRIEYWAQVMNDTEYLQSSGYMDSEEERASLERKLIIRSMSERWPHILVR